MIGNPLKIKDIVSEMSRGGIRIPEIQRSYHHIFPKKFLNARGMDRYVRDEMANIAFLGQKANRRISAQEPKVYLAEIAEQDPRRLGDQFVPMDQSLWELDRFEDFLAARRTALAEAMNAVLEE